MSRVVTVERSNLRTRATFEKTDGQAHKYPSTIVCQRMEGRFPPTTLAILAGCPLNDYFVAGGGMVVVSEPLKAILDEHRCHAEYFRLRIVFEGAEYTDQNYYFCNVLDSVDCFDRSRGECTFYQDPGFTDFIKDIDRLVIDEAKASSHELFRMARCGPNILCASDELADALLDAKMTGLRILAPEEWYAGC